jgi:chromosome segregation ATPase
MAKSPTALIHELELTVAVLTHQVSEHKQELEKLQAAIREAVKDGASGKELARLEVFVVKSEAQLTTTADRLIRLEERLDLWRAEVGPTAMADVQREMAVLKAEFAEFRDRAKTKEAWSRGVIASALFALLTAVVSLIVGLVRK